MSKKFILVAYSIVLFLISSYPCQAEELFLRRDGGFQIHIESDWVIDPLKAYEQATELLGNKLKINGVSYQGLTTITQLNEELATKDRAYGKVYRMQLTGFVSDDEMAKARSEVKTQLAQMQVQILSSISIVLASAVLFALGFIKADRLFSGDKRTTVGIFFTAWFLIAILFAMGAIW